MLRRLDRIQVVVRDTGRAVRVWEDLLGAEPRREGGLESLRTHRTVLQVGESEIELLEPTGPGPAADQLATWGEGLFAAGFAVDSLGDIRERLASRGVRWTEEGDQIFIEPRETNGLRTVLSRLADRPSVGPLRWIYEVSHLVRSWKEAMERHTELFGLDSSAFSEIASEQYGYTGTLLLFDPPARLDRIELCEITQPEKAMGRFYRRRGETLYMCYAECDDTGSLLERLRTHGARFAAPPDDPAPPNLFIHPSAMCGVLLGVSRTHWAWIWSGRPELAHTPGSG